MERGRTHKIGNAGEEEGWKRMTDLWFMEWQNYEPDKGREVGQPSWVPSLLGSFVQSFNKLC